MLDLARSHFLSPGKSLRELSLLLAVHHGSRVTQSMLAEETNLSPARVNSYLKELSGQGHLSIRPRNQRDYHYSLSPVGEDRLGALLLDFSAEIVRLYAQVKRELARRLAQQLPLERRCRVVLFGAADTAELVIQALQEVPLAEIVGLVDNNQDKWGQQVLGHSVLPPTVLLSLRPDFLIVSSFGRQREIVDSIHWLRERGVEIITLSPLDETTPP